MTTKSSRMPPEADSRSEGLSQMGRVYRFMPVTSEGFGSCLATEGMAGKE